MTCKQVAKTCRRSAPGVNYRLKRCGISTRKPSEYPKPHQGSLKACPRCGIKKAWVHFSKNKGKSNGHHSYCKKCNKARSAAVIRSRKHVVYRETYKTKHFDRYRADRILWSMRIRGDGLQGLTRDSIIRDMNSGLRCPYCQTGLTTSNLSYDHKDGRGSSMHPVCIECNLFKNIIHHDDFVKFVEIIGHEKLMFYRSNVRRAWDNRFTKRHGAA